MAPQEDSTKEQESPSGVSSTGISRREVLKRLAAIAGSVALVGTGIYTVKKGHEESPEDKLAYDAYLKPEGLPEDVLTKEELRRAGITVYQTPDVQLYIRRGALEIPIFKDAANHRINGLIISLVDHNRLSWNAIDRLPKDAKSIWRKFHSHPNKWPESYWQDLKRYENEMVTYHQGMKRTYQDQLAEIVSGRRESFVRESVDFYRSQLEKNKNDQQDQKSLKYWEDKLKDILNGQEEERLKSHITGEETGIQEATDKVSVIDGPRDQAVSYFAEYEGEAQGTLIRPDPAWDNKAYIYLCVKNEFQPHPKQSYPGPEQFEVFPNQDSYAVYSKDSLPGFILRHETGHYEEAKPKVLESEEEANRVAYERVLEAWKRYQETGDTSGYPFVFVTKEGLTITKNINPQSSETV